jgi:hypothetical protein
MLWKQCQDSPLWASCVCNLRGKPSSTEIDGVASAPQRCIRGTDIRCPPDCRLAGVGSGPVHARDDQPAHLPGPPL